MIVMMLCNTYPFIMSLKLSYLFLQATCKHERRIASLRALQQHICKRLKDTETRFQENDGLLHRVENEIKLLKSNDQTSEVSQSN